jgi:hypothetical protein
MDPRNAVLGVVVDDRMAMTPADIALRENKALWQFSFDQVTGHSESPIRQEFQARKNHAVQALESNRKGHPNCGKGLPILESSAMTRP